jgi:hypothetical protein
MELGRTAFLVADPEGLPGGQWDVKDTIGRGGIQELIGRREKDPTKGDGRFRASYRGGQG